MSPNPNTGALTIDTADAVNTPNTFENHTTVTSGTLNNTAEAMLVNGSFNFSDPRATLNNSGTRINAGTINVNGLSSDLYYTFMYSNGAQTLRVHAVPEPSSLLLLGLALVLFTLGSVSQRASLTVTCAIAS